MNKIFILWLLPLVTLSSALAVDVGDNFTQAQLDNVNVNTYNLQCNYHGYDITYLLWVPYEVRYDLSCLSAQPAEGPTGPIEGLYTVIRPHFYKSFKFHKLWDCVTQTNQSFCRDKVQTDVQNYLISQKQSIRYNFRELQTPPFQVENFNYTIEIDLTEG